MSINARRRATLVCVVVISLATLGLRARVDPPNRTRAGAELAAGFRDVPASARLRMYWRVFGPAWTETEIDRELALLKKAGLGGVTAYFLYPVALDDPERGIANERFGSREFLKTFAHAARQAAALGLRFSINGGTGWPYGGPTVSGPDAAQQLREVRMSAGTDPRTALKLGAGEELVAAFVAGRNVTGDLASGKLAAPLPGELRAYISGPTGMNVKRASYGGEGPVLSHYDRPALERWLRDGVQPLLDAAPGLVEGVGCDSLEVYHANWTPRLPGEFRKRRGYDFIPRLPELFDETSPDRADLRYDFWRTLAEVTEEQFTRTLGEWCRRNRVDLEMEPYGTPPNPETAARYISLPTGEHYEWKGFAVQRYVASMAHICGRPVVGSEAWTWAGLPNRLADSLSDLKLVSDMAFLSGANDLTGVDFPYSPPEAGSPGWMPYYGPVMGETNPQWRFFPALASYLSRCQWMLRQGAPVRPVAVYLPVEDSLAAAPVDQLTLDFSLRDRLASGHPTSEFGLGNALKHHSDLVFGLIAAGYGFDGLDFWAMTRLGRRRGSELALGQAKYQALVLPDIERMDVNALALAADFCRGGGTVVAAGRLPERVPGLGREKETRELRTLEREIFGEAPAVGRPHPCGRGRGIFVVADDQAAEALRPFVVPSVTLSPRQATVGTVQRTYAGGEIYFFVNVGPGPARFTAEFSGPPRELETWDALSGTISRVSSSGRSMALNLPPRSSTFVVAGNNTADALAESGPERGAPSERLKLDLDWDLTFDGPEAPPPAKLRTLTSWTDLSGGKFFSGTGTYRTNFFWPGADAPRCVLGFTEIHEAAEVRLNGRSLGIIFGPPYEVDVGPALMSGRNELEVTVVNLPLNRFLGLPDEDLGPLRARFGARFGAPEEKKVSEGPAASGLIGDVWLVRRGVRGPAMNND